MSNTQLYLLGGNAKITTNMYDFVIQNSTPFPSLQLIIVKETLKIEYVSILWDSGSRKQYFNQIYLFN
jgi:hypothetical protein